MSNDMVLFEEGAVVSAKFAGMQIDGDLSGGVGGNYAILSLKGGRFHLKYRGENTTILNEKGEPVGSVEAVLIKANDYLTKTYYEKGYVEGDSSPPDCHSLDGKVPAPSVAKPQHSNCMTCPKNTFSKVNEQTGKKTKWCADTRKLAIVPLEDLKNESFGGPMLFRITASALKDLATFGDTLKARGYPYNAVAVRIGMDLSVSYPKPTFKAIRPLTDDEAEQVLEWYQSDAVAKLLADFEDIAPAGAAPVETAVFEQEPAQEAPKPTPPPPPPVVKPKAPEPTKGGTFGAKPAPAAAPPPAAVTPPKTPPAAKPAKAAPKAPPPPAEPVDTTTEVVPGNLESDIESILADLNGVAGE